MTADHLRPLVEHVAVAAALSQASSLLAQNKVPEEARGPVVALALLFGPTSCFGCRFSRCKRGFLLSMTICTLCAT